MAAVARSTPIYTVPPTQNTAPVLEFRCLYTHDILKKQKKWHDGSLRFHTFNRRVMVYDETKNYIGDLHYRGDEEFGEGTELQLDRPVKVEVGEPLGETQTDLRPILDRGRAERNAVVTSQDPAVARSIRRINAGTNGGKPKTLSEVLGGSQGRLGRAKLLTQSPYDQRIALAEINDGQPAAKRLRLCTGKEDPISVKTKASGKSNDHISRLAMRQQVDDSRSRLIQAPAGRSHMPRSTAFHTTSPHHKLQGDHDSTETRNCERPSTVPKQAENSVSRSPTIPLRKSSTTNGHRREDSEVRRKDLRSLASASHSNRLSKSRDQNVSAISCATGVGTTGALRPGMTFLRMRPQQNRRKLLYKALIPNTGKDATTGKEPFVAIDKQPLKASSEQQQALVEIQPSHTRLSNVVLNDVDSTLENEHRPQSKSKHKPNQYTDSSPNPFLLSQQFSHINTPSEPIPCDNDMDFMLDIVDGTQVSVVSSCVAQDKPHETGPRTSTNSAIQNTVLGNAKTDAEDEVQSSATPPSPSPPSPPSPQAIERSSVESKQSAPPIAGHHLLNTETQANRVSHAMSKVSPSPFEVHDKTKQQLPNQDEIVSAPVGSVVPKASISPSMETSQPQRTTPKESFPQAHSDIAAIIPQPAINTELAPQVRECPNTLDQAKDQGPWSKLEAFLLFENWPASRIMDKPSFVHPIKVQEDEDFDDYDGIDEHINLSIDTSSRNVRTMTKSNLLPGIRSARYVLRDEV